MEKQNSIEILFLRHGETQYNEERRYLSYTDLPLTEKGKAYIKSLSQGINYPECDMVFTSSRKRAKETADILFPDMEKIEDAGFDEMNFGEFEGKTYEELMEDERYRKWLDGGSVTAPPGGEDRKTVIARMMEALNRSVNIALNSDKPVKRIAVVAHSGTTMALVSVYSSIGYYDASSVFGGGFLCNALLLDGGDNNAKVSHFSNAIRVGG